MYEQVRKEGISLEGLKKEAREALSCISSNTQAVEWGKR